MNQAKGNPEREFDITLAYYKRTVWNHVRNLPLADAQFHVALRAWERLDTAQRAWANAGEQSFDDLPNWDQKREAATVDIQPLRPRPQERDGYITPELLAKIASARLGVPRPKSFRNAAEQAHKLLVACRDYLKDLPEPNKKPGHVLEAYFDSVSFKEILDSSGRSDCFPLLPTVQKGRNDGKITNRALEQAIKRHAADAAKEIQQEIQEALKNKEISCRLLEEIRWQRFRRHFKG